MKRKLTLLAVTGLVAFSVMSITSCTSGSDSSETSSSSILAEEYNKGLTLILIAPTTMDEGETNYVSTKITNLNKGEVTYSSSDDDVVSVTSNGQITAEGAGTATVTAKIATSDGDVTDSAEIRVNPKEGLYYKVSFVNYDNTFLYEDLVKYGEAATYVGPSPIRTADYKTVYTFTGWNREFSNVTRDLTIKAVYQEDDGSGFVFTTANQQCSLVRYTGTGAETVVVPSMYAGLPVTSIDSGTSTGAFDEVEGVKKIVLPDGISKIGKYSFYNMPELEEINIPSSTYEFGSYVFFKCKALTKVDLPSNLRKIPENMFYYCSGLTSFALPTTVAEIGKNAFYDCTGLTTVTLNEGLQAIDNGAFYGCTSLTSIDIPESVTTIGNPGTTSCNVFRGNSKLATVTGCEGVTNIGYGAFYDCEVLTGVPFTTNLVSVGDSVFDGCTLLTTGNLPDTVTTLGKNVFYNCKSLTEAHYPNTLDTVYTGFYDNCDKLTKVTGMDSVVSIMNLAFSGCGFTSITADFFPTTCTSIGNNAFSSLDNLETVTIPNTVTTVDMYSFQNNYKLTAVTFEAGINPVTIGNYIFSNDELLTSVVWPTTVASLGSDPFKGCSSMTNYILPLTITNMGVMDGVLYDKDTNPTTLYTYPAGKTDTSFTVPDTVKTIGYSGYSAFYKAKNLQTLDLNKVTKIAVTYAFNKSSIKSVIIPSTLSTWTSSYAFMECTQLTSVTFNATGLTKIPASSFAKDSALPSISLPTKIVTIDNYSFQECTSLTTMTLGATAKMTFGTYALKDSGIKTINYAGKMATMKTSTFKSKSIPDGTVIKCSDGDLTVSQTDAGVVSVA